MSKSISGTIVITTMFFFTFLSTQSFGFTQGDVNQLQNRGSCKKCDLENADLSGVDLSNAALEKAVMNGINLSGANLSGATLHGAVVSGATFCNTITSDGETDSSGC